MTTTTKTYAAKSSVIRALKAAKIDPETMNINQGPEGWYASPKAAEKTTTKPRNGNCKRVWDIADSMKGQRRKDVVAACVAAGINLGTAKTQYQQWYATQK